MGERKRERETWLLMIERIQEREKRVRRTEWGMAWDTHNVV